MHHLRVPARAGALLAVACFLVSASPASAALDEVDTQKLRKAVTVNGILGHERALQSIANLNGGTRASGTPGYDASAAYVKRKLQAAGYKVTEQEFEFPFFEETAPAVFERTSPTPRTYVNPDEFVTMEYSGSGDATAAVQAVDVQVPPPAQPGSTERLRGRRLRRLHRRQHRAHPARHVRLRGQGGERRGGRRERRDHLQRGPARPAGDPQRHARRPRRDDPRASARASPSARSSSRLGASQVHIATSTLTRDAPDHERARRLGGR